MTRRRRSLLAAETMRLSADVARRLGQGIREARRRRHWTQATLGAKVGISQVRQGEIERGLGTGAPLDTWIGESLALGVPLRVEFGLDPRRDPVDAGHLATQELLLRTARALGRPRTFELPTRSSDPSRSVDVLTRDDRQRVLLIQECWNRLDDIGGAVRSTNRKIAEAEALAVAIGGDRGPYRVAACWILRDTAHNRNLVRRYPEVFASRFPGSSAAWVNAITTGGAPPTESGLVWSDLRATRLFAWRRQPRTP